ncbi:Ribonuclease P protein subunit p30 [Halotydeus destructor]|nr:Ribonuclease P protein subunit p30 [Halotydeus destructor]
MDLNIVVHHSRKSDAPDVIQKKLKAAYKLGHKIVALAVHIEAEDIDKIPEVPAVKFGGNSDKFRVYTRLTVAVDDASHTHKLSQSETARKYDLLALEPKNDKTLNMICGGSFPCDIICFNMTERMLVNLKTVNLTLPQSRGVCFEINYDEALHNQTNCQNVISAGQLLVEKAKGKNILLSSGSKAAIFLRSPHDIANLGAIFSLKETQAKSAAFTAGYLALKHSQGRRNINQVAVDSCIPQSTSDKLIVNRLTQSDEVTPAKRPKIAEIN